MKTTLKIYLLLLILFAGVFSSCKKNLEKLNQNPNGADPSTTNPNLVLSTVLTSSGQEWVTLGFGDVAGITTGAGTIAGRPSMISCGITNMSTTGR